MSSLILYHHDQNPHSSKKRKVIEKKVLKAKNMEGNVEKLVKGEFPPNDSWSWRKYGQKPIKGSPYPRSYYRCSSSKGCLAKKQVEKCKEDAFVLITTYTSTHTHPGPKEPQTRAHAHALAQAQVRENESHPMCPKQDQQQHSNDNNDRDEYTPSQEGVNVDFDVKPTPPSPKQEEEAITLEDDSCSASLGNVLAVDRCLRRMSSSPSENEENNGFYVELEELPTSYVSSFYSFMRFDEGILVLPS